MNFEVDDIEGNQALDYNQLARQRDFGVDNGCGVSINTGTLGSGGNALTVAAGDIMFNGSSVSVTSQSVDIDTGGTNPRQDVVYLDSTGSVVVSTGTPEAVFPSDDDLTTFEYQRPAPNDLSETDAVVLCTVWVAAGATSISASDVRDRRVSSTASFTSVDTDNLFTDSRLYDVTVWQDGSGTWYADGAEGVIDSGTNPEVVLQAAIDSLTNNTGVVYAKRLDPATVSVTVPETAQVVYDWGGKQWYQSKNNLRFWSGDKQVDDYQGIMWYPEARGSASADADVQMIAHHAKADGTVDKDWSMYTADSVGQLTKRVDLGYGEDLPRIRWRNLAFWGAVANEFKLNEGGLRSTGSPYFRYTPSSADRSFLFDPRPGTGGNARVRLFRSTSTSGARVFEIFKGDGTGTRTFGIDAQYGDIVAVRDFATGSAVGFRDGIKYDQRGAPTTSELASGERMTYTSDGTDGHAAGDLVSARNDAGTIVDQVIAPASNDT